MKVAIMQPYFFPYLGYFQLINTVDIFVIYDNVKFTKKGWFHRNRLRFGDNIEYFSISIKNDSDYLDVVDRRISPLFFQKEMPKILRKIKQHYSKAPYFDSVFPVIKNAFEYQEENLFHYLKNSLQITIEYLDIDTKVLISSQTPVDHSLKNKYRIFELCKYLDANLYINPIGGKEMYSKEEFAENNIRLKFLKQELHPYAQFNFEFESGLSIIDVMMFNSKEKIQDHLNSYTII